MSNLHVIEVPFHIGDFLSGTIHMDAQETGAYIMLIMAHYQAGEKGLPNDDKKLAQIAKVSPRVWKKIKGTLAEKFEVNENVWLHKKIIKVLRKISEKSNAAKAKSLKRWDSDDATASRQQSHSNANQKPITNKKKKIIKKEKEPDLESKENPIWFEGQVIRLNKSDYTTWLERYGGSDDQFMDWLANRDSWYESQAPQVRNNWFIATSNAIAKFETV